MMDFTDEYKAKRTAAREELIAAGKELRTLTEKHCTMAAEYVRQHEVDSALARWDKAEKVYQNFV